jgi:DNA-directed RNA polymerase subunit H
MANPVSKHALVPQHTKLNKTESEEVLKKYNITRVQLPKILITDPAIVHLKPNFGDIIKIERTSPTRGTSAYYRVVINA